jgi:hypothetical protein
MGISLEEQSASMHHARATQMRSYSIRRASPPPPPHPPTHSTHPPTQSRTRNARTRTHTNQLHKAEMEATHPYEVFQLRAMLAVPYFEKALYELPESELTKDRVLRLADEIEVQVQGGLATRPLMSVPHIISDEASCYYHGYVLAEMSVHQTRAHFLKKGPIVDNPAVGAALRESYWKPGNSSMFLDLVRNLTGRLLLLYVFFRCMWLK